MLEIPEAIVISRQIKKTWSGRTVVEIVAGQCPHKFAFFNGDPTAYPERLQGKVLENAQARSGMVHVLLSGTTLVFSDGAALRFHPAGSKRPDNHQLLLAFDDGTVLSVSIQMYGGIWCFQDADFANPYYQIAGEKPSPLSEAFNQAYFAAILADPATEKLSAKAALATEQRIPGLGNGVLQDILYRSKIHPRQIIRQLDQTDRERLFQSIKTTLAEMADQGGRDTEKDLFCQPGGYQTQMSKNTAGKACPICGRLIRKEAYMGGSVYYCPGCQVQK